MNEIKVMDIGSCEVIICICPSCNTKFGICSGDLDILEYCPHCGIKVNSIDTDD